MSLSSSTSSASQSEANWSAFLNGTPPRLLLEDIYRFGEDYLCDLSDSLESEVLRLCEEQAKRSRGRIVRREGAGAASAAKGSSNPTDSALQEEVAAGADNVWKTMLQAYELVGDQFELYAHRNVFTWPEGLEVPTSSAAGSQGSGKAYPASEEEAVASRVAALEAQLAKERKRKRTLLHIKGLLAKRVPQAEAASQLLEEVMGTLQQQQRQPQAGGGASQAPQDTFQSFFDQTGRLHALCDRLSEASPAAAQAISSALSAEGGGEGEGAAGRQGRGGRGEAEAGQGQGEGEEEEEEDVLGHFAAEGAGKGRRK